MGNSLIYGYNMARSTLTDSAVCNNACVWKVTNQKLNDPEFLTYRSKCDIILVYES